MDNPGIEPGRISFLNCLSGGKFQVKIAHSYRIEMKSIDELTYNVKGTNLRRPL